MRSESRASRTLILLAGALGVTACEPATPNIPETPGLDPVERDALLYWTVSDPARSLGPAATDAVDRLRPNGVLAVGDASAWLTEDPTAENPSLTAVLEWIAATSESTGQSLALGVEVPLLPGSVADACFDPSDPTADPSVAELRDGLVALLEHWPEVSAVMPNPVGDTAFWDVSCTCTPCDGTDASSMAERAGLLWGVAQQEIAVRQRTAWWWHNAPDTLGQGAPDGDQALPRQAMDLVLNGDVDPLVPVRALPGRGVGGPWAPVDSVLARSTERRIAGSLDVASSGYGPTDALLLNPLDLYAQFREERSQGVTAWFAQVDGGGRTALGTLEEMDLRLVESAFRDPTTDPYELLSEALQDRFGLDEEDGRFLGRMLGEIGHAMGLATHPLGIPIVGAGGPTPASLPLAYESPATFDGAWTERVQAVTQPDQDALVQANQWAMEAALTTSAAIGELNTVQERLLPVDEALLRRRLKTLDFAVRAWGRLALADITLRAYENGSQDSSLPGYLAYDALTLDLLADEVDGAVASGAILDPYPVVTANLRAVADQLAAAAAGAEAQSRDFPVLYRARHDFVDGRLNYYWTVTPPGIGWVERGVSFPAYDETSSIGTEDATWWHSWTTGVPADTKVTWRACTESDSGQVVCSSDRVVWTPL